MQVRSNAGFQRPEPGFRRAEPDVRRRSLIAACARVMARDGLAGASVRVIAAEAGVSPGLVGHYFPAIEALLAATYAETDTMVNALLEAALEAAGPDPRARIEAFVAASFEPPIADRELLGTWIACWTLAHARSEIAAQHDAQYGAFRARLEALLAECGIAADRRRHAAIALTALIDGLWLELCLSPGTFAPGEAAQIARASLAALISTDR